MRLPMQALPVFLDLGFDPFQKEYEARSLLLGKRVQFLNGPLPILGRATSIAPDGSLFVQVDGEIAPRGFLSGEVTGLEVVVGEPMMHGTAE
jgi:biotin-(acetyl-CoA carboxylase) ligase